MTTQRIGITGLCPKSQSRNFDKTTNDLLRDQNTNGIQKPSEKKNLEEEDKKGLFFIFLI